MACRRISQLNDQPGLPPSAIMDVGPWGRDVDGYTTFQIRDGEDRRRSCGGSGAVGVGGGGLSVRASVRAADDVLARAFESSRFGRTAVGGAMPASSPMEDPAGSIPDDPRRVPPMADDAGAFSRRP